MNKHLVAGLLAAGFLTTAHQADAARLNLSYWQGSMMGNAHGIESCGRTGRGALRTNIDVPGGSEGTCWVTIALPFAPGTNVHQISLYYSSDLGSEFGHVSAYLGSKAFVAETESTSLYDPIASLELDAAELEMPPMGMASAELLTSEFAPGFEEGFTVSEEGAYTLVVGVQGDAAFFGASVDYEAPATVFAPRPHPERLAPSRR